MSGKSRAGRASRIILASGSPRRRELLDQVGIDYEVVKPELDEERFSHGDPAVLARTIAEEKARVVHALVAGRPGGRGPRTDARHEARWILAADTVVAVGGHLLGKPRDREHARAMIGLLAGRAHLVVTGVAIWPPAAADPVVRSAETTVSFASISGPEMESYLDFGDWQDVAGAYRIQGRAARHIDWISGSYSNVVGLPIHLVYSILMQYGYPFG